MVGAISTQISTVLKSEGNVIIHADDISSNINSISRYFILMKPSILLLLSGFTNCTVKSYKFFKRSWQLLLWTLVQELFCPHDFIESDGYPIIRIEDSEHMMNDVPQVIDRELFMRTKSTGKPYYIKMLELKDQD